MRLGLGGYGRRPLSWKKRNDSVKLIAVPIVLCGKHRNEHRRASIPETPSGYQLSEVLVR